MRDYITHRCGEYGTEFLRDPPGRVFYCYGCRCFFRRATDGGERDGAVTIARSEPRAPHRTFTASDFLVEPEAR